MMPKYYWILLLTACLSACGGGGDASSSPEVMQITNTAPTISDPGDQSLLEGETEIVSISASDAQNNSLTFSISSGDDSALFTITPEGALAFAAAPDFEAPGDADTDNVYELAIEVSDGSLTDTQALMITVTDAFEGRVVDAPISGATVFVDLNGNNEQDPDEPSGVTDDSGFFNVDTFTVPEGSSAKVISKGGRDTKTGKELPDLALISDVPADITKPANVTPLTTVVASVDTPEAKAQVLLAMGIDKTPEELLTTDNWAAAEAGDETAKSAQRVNQQVGLLLQTAATVADDGDAATDISVSLAKSVAVEISTAAASDAGIDFTSEGALTAVLASAVAEVAPEVVVEASAIAAVASSVATVNLVVADPTLDPLSDVAADIVQSAQEELQTSVADVVSGEVSVADFETATDTTQLFADVVVAVDALDTDEDGIPDALDADDDGDGVIDAKDAFSIDATETIDTDGDGIGNNADTDDDGDSVLDTADAFPLDKTETLDTDSDGIGNNADTDDDGDGVTDAKDAFPIDATETIDTDGDGIGNNADTDDDGDSVLDTADAFPLDKTETLDTDSDGIGNNADTDDDGDGVTDAKDALSIDATETIDTDGDGIGNNADKDDDADGVLDTADAFPLDRNETLDTDSDGIGNNADKDDDADGVLDTADAFPLDKNETLDTDSDGIGNNADKDDDADGVLDTADAFPLDKNETLDTDSDGIGNNADKDDDADGVLDTADAFPLDKNETLDTDSDGIGNNADKDDDADGVLDTADAFPLDKSEALDTDRDGIGNTADTDDDGDGVADARDAFPLISMSGAADTDGDGRPNDCDRTCQATGMSADDDDDGDGVSDDSDIFPLDKTETIDTDRDGIGNNADNDDDGDGVSDGSDACPLDSGETIDTDSDGTCNNDDDDDDGDGVTDRSDAFPLDKTETLDTDSDGIGNNTDNDDDGDGVADGSDACPLDPRETLDTDSDGVCNNTDDDDDGDGVSDGSDAFPLDKTETLDTDRDGTGNNADPDDDNDGVADGSDDYPLNSDVHTAPTTAAQSLSLNLLPKTTNAKTGTLTSTSQDSRRVTYTIVSNGSLGTATLTDSSTGAFSYSTTSTASGDDSFTYKVNDGYVDSTASTISIGLNTDPLYKYQWHLNNTGQTNFTNNSGTTGADLNVDTVIAPSDSRIASVTGQGVTIAIVDDGMELAHEDLSGNVVANKSWDYIDADLDPTPSWSGVSHGTMVASIAAAKGWNNIGIRGVAPNASLKAYNVTATGAYNDVNEINALGSSPLASDVSVFNMSYGSGTFGTALLPLPSDAKFAQIAAGATSLRANKGALYVNSVGNDYFTGATGTGNFSYCGNGANAGTLKISCYDTIFDRVFFSAYLIGVAALNAEGVKASYSTAGSATWISAYGGEFGTHTDYGSSGSPAITAADRSSCAKGANSSVSNEGNKNGVRANAFNDYQSPHSENPSCNYTNIMNGTSSAAPMVSGVIALMLEANSSLTARDVKHILATTATQVDSSFSATAIDNINYVFWETNDADLKFHPWYGFGAIDADAAVSAARDYRAGSLGTLAFSDWNNSNVRAGADILEGQVNTFELDAVVRGKTIEHTNIALKINHAAPNHLGFRLESPSGTISTLLPPYTALSTALSSSNWVYLPTNAFYGEDTAGTWKLHIYDHVAGTSGALVQWGMQFGYH